MSPKKKARATRPHVTVIIPCLNEERVLPLLRERLVVTLDGLDVDWSVIFVDDGSRDSTPGMLATFQEQERRFRVVALSRNFGHQVAVSAGIAHVDAETDATFILDADLQDPPELLGACLAMWRDGADVVYAVRQARKEGLLLRASYSLFYRALSALSSIEIPLDAGDFCLMDRRVVSVLKRMPEQNPFVRGMRAWSGFDQRALPYERSARAAGETKYPLRRLVKLAVDGLLSTSASPLRLATYLGFLVVAASLVGACFVLAWRLLGFSFMGHTAEAIPGWAGLVTISFFLGGVQLLVVGVIGEYVARIYDDVRGRPRWVVAWTAGMTETNDDRR